MPCLGSMCCSWESVKQGRFPTHLWAPATVTGLPTISIRVDESLDCISLSFSPPYIGGFHVIVTGGRGLGERHSLVLSVSAGSQADVSQDSLSAVRQEESSLSSLVLA